MTVKQLSPVREFSQRRRWMKTRFAMGPTQLLYAVDGFGGASLQKSVDYGTIGPPGSHVRITEADRGLRWVCIVITVVAVASSLRGGPQPFTFFFHLLVILLVLAGARLTSKLRGVRYTAVPAGEINLFVLDDAKHDEIIAELESRRRAAWLAAAAAAPGLTVRDELRRLRILVENEVLPPEEFERRQRQLLPHEARAQLPSPPGAGAPQRFVQRKIGVRVTIDLHPDRLGYERETWFGGAERLEVHYRDLPAPTVHIEADVQFELYLLLIGWTGAGVLGWMAALDQRHGPGYYVGWIGLRRTIYDHGPAILFLFAVIVLLAILTQRKFARPWPGVILLQDSQYDALLAAIEHRRIAALRQMAEPDPLLTIEEQLDLLSTLRDAEIISEAEQAEFAARAQEVCADAALDEALEDSDPVPASRAMH